MIDPLITIVIATSLAILFLLAARHKLAEPQRFEAQLAAYRLLPDSMLSPIARTLPFVELAVATGMLFTATRPMAGLVAATLLTVYALAMAINIKRGRSKIDCGCGDTPQPLSALLLLRNTILACGALLMLAPAMSRSLGVVDMLFAALLVIIFVLSYIMLEHLSRNHSLLITKE